MFREAIADIWHDVKLAALLAAVIVLFPIIAAFLIMVGYEEDPYG